MIAIFEKQYALVQSSRAVVLNFIETEIGNDLNTPRCLLITIAQSAICWNTMPVVIFTGWPILP